MTQKIVAAAWCIASGSQEYLYLGDIAVVHDWGWAPKYVQVMYLMLQQEQADSMKKPFIKGSSEHGMLLQSY